MRVAGIKKTYVQVNADVDPDGNIHPNHIIWRDGRRLEIDRVLDVQPRASLKAGGAGLRFTVRILGKQTYLFQEDTPMADTLTRFRWFVEEKVWAED